MKRGWLVLLLPVLLFSTPFAAGAAPTSGEGNRTPFPAWEYKVLRIFEIAVYGPKPVSLEEGLNKLGAEGWELVAVEPEREGVSTTFYFKRPKPPRVTSD